MSTDLLREAAALMRERAKAATPGPWAVESSTAVVSPGVAWVFDYGEASEADAAHIASWHPAVALAVAKAMDDVADAWEIADGWALDPDDGPIRFEDTLDGGWVDVARAYLGRPA